MSILQTIQASQMPDEMKKASLLAYASLRSIVSVSFETFLMTIATRLRPDIAAMEQAARELNLTEEKQIGLVAIFLESIENGSEQELGAFLGDLVRSVKSADENVEMRSQGQPHAGRVFDTPPASPWR